VAKTMYRELASGDDALPNLTIWKGKHLNFQSPDGSVDIILSVTRGFQPVI